MKTLYLVSSLGVSTAILWPEAKASLFETIAFTTAFNSVVSFKMRWPSLLILGFMVANIAKKSQDLATICSKIMDHGKLNSKPKDVHFKC